MTVVYYPRILKASSGESCIITRDNDGEQSEIFNELFFPEIILTAPFPTDESTLARARRRTLLLSL